MNSIRETLLKHQQEIEVLRAESEKLREKARQVADNAKNDLGNVGEAGKEVLGSMVDFAGDLAEGVAGMIDTDTFSNIAGAIGDIVGGIVENIDL